MANEQTPLRQARIGLGVCQVTLDDIFEALQAHIDGGSGLPHNVLPDLTELREEIGSIQDLLAPLDSDQPHRLHRRKSMSIRSKIGTVRTRLNMAAVLPTRIEPEYATVLVQTGTVITFSSGIIRARVLRYAHEGDSELVTWREIKRRAVRVK